MRVVQPEGTKGSLKWLQRAVESDPRMLQPAALPPIDWLSPRRDDEFAEYRDGAFLDLLELSHLRPALAAFWPARGPQWDALGRAGEVRVLVEAKAHVGEMLSPSTRSSAASRARIAAAFADVHLALGIRSATDWTATFYQYGNRLAHLWWLRTQGVNAHLVFVSFLNDTEMDGPTSPETWHTAYQVAEHALGLPRRHALLRFIHHVCPDAGELAVP